MVAFAAVVVDDVEKDLDAGVVQPRSPRKTGPGRHCSQPNTKIPNRVKLSLAFNLPGSAWFPASSS